MKLVRDEFAFPRFLKFWRGVHNVSQEELASLLECSPRHVSRLETAQCRPSEAIINQIGSGLKLGKRDLNHLRISAGFAPDETEVDFNSPDMKWLRKSMLRTLRALDPFPATLLDSKSRILMVNRGFVSLFSRTLSADALNAIENNFDFIFGDEESKARVPEWEDVLSAILMANQQAALFSNNREHQQHIEELEARPSVPEDWKQRAAKIEPVASFRVKLALDGVLHDFFNVSTTVGALGPAAFVSEPRLTINTLYPEDEDLDLSSFMREDARHPLLFY